MIPLGDWMPPEPLQGVHLDRLHGDTYDLRAVGVMSGLVPDAIPCDGVLQWASRSQEYRSIIEATQSQIRGFAAYYGGVAHQTKSGWIIKAVAPKMRSVYRFLPTL